jgi:long-chain acyl-CoA synthetase
MSSLSMNLVKAACNYPQHVALRCADLQYTFSEFGGAAARVRVCRAATARSLWG